MSRKKNKFDVFMPKGNCTHTQKDFYKTSMGAKSLPHFILCYILNKSEIKFSFQIARSKNCVGKELVQNLFAVLSNHNDENINSSYYFMLISN